MYIMKTMDRERIPGEYLMLHGLSQIFHGSHNLLGSATQKDSDPLQRLVSCTFTLQILWIRRSWGTLSNAFAKSQSLMDWLPLSSSNYVFTIIGICQVSQDYTFENPSLESLITTILYSSSLLHNNVGEGNRAGVLRVQMVIIFT